MKQPPMIKYNLKDRDRKYRGQERNFNIQAICDSINSPATQEMIKTRAMLGYYGHKPRMLAGMNVTESMVVAGKYQEIEPAIVTTHLKAYPDGTIEHQTEFLDSISGKKASRMFNSRIGGFSSAIDHVKNIMFGFDYVLDPNYSSNRGFSLDSVDGMTFDSVIESIHEEEEEFWLRLIAEKDNQISLISASLDSAQADNEQLLSMLSTGKENGTIATGSGNNVVTVSLDSVNRINKDRAYFIGSASLPGYVEESDRSKKATGLNHSVDDFKSRMGY